MTRKLEEIINHAPELPVEAVYNQEIKVKHTLQEIEDLYHAGIVSQDYLEAYITLWRNIGPHYSTAYISYEF